MTSEKKQGDRSLPCLYCNCCLLLFDGYRLRSTHPARSWIFVGCSVRTMVRETHPTLAKQLSIPQSECRFHGQSVCALAGTLSHAAHCHAATCVVSSTAVSRIAGSQRHVLIDVIGSLHHQTVVGFSRGATSLPQNRFQLRRKIRHLR